MKTKKWLHSCLPLLKISAVSFSPEIVSPGKQFNMAVTLTNHGEYNVYNVTLDVLSIAGMPDLNIFSMVGNGNHFYIEEIPTGKSTTIEIANLGSNPVKGVQVSLSSDQIEFQKNYQYYGTFEKNDYDGFPTKISFDQGGAFPFKIVLKYRDSFNNERFIEKEINLLVPEDEVIEKDDDESVGFFQKIIKVIFGIGV